jgi:ribonuclease R
VNIGYIPLYRKPMEKRDNRKSFKKGPPQKRPVEKVPMPRATHLEGILRMSRIFNGYVTDPISNISVEVPQRFLNHAFEGDTVRVRIHGHSERGGLYGEVEEITARRRTRYVCEIKEENGIMKGISPNPKMYTSFSIAPDKQNGAVAGDLVLVKVISWEEHTQEPVAQVEMVLGKALSHNTEMLAILYDKGIDIDFPPHLLQAAEEVRAKFTPEEVARRRNFRHIATCTIDPADAKDFDDALSVNHLENGDVEVGVHIADVSFYVEEGSPLDVEAARRATSVYMVDRTIPMLPPSLSDDLCSLNENEEKFVFSAVFTFDKAGKLKDEWFGRGIIRSGKRFSYEEAQEVLNTGKGVFVKELQTLNRIAYVLRKEKVANGAISFRENEVKFTLDEYMRPVAIEKKARLDTHMLVEDFMLLANRRVTYFVESLSKKSGVKKPFVYRVHDTPNREKVERLLDLLKSLGYSVTISDNITSKDINKILEVVKGKPEEALVNTAAIQTMAKAIYDTENIGHFGLAFSHYTHFTSPIRRYPDVLVHRLLARHLNGEKITDEELKRLSYLVTYSSQMERRAQEAERESIKYKQAEFMSGKIGTTYKGIVSGVSKFGLFIEEETTRAEGFIGMRDLPEDFYMYDEKKFALIGRRTRKTYQLGDPIKIMVKAVDLKRKEITYRLV